MKNFLLTCFLALLCLVGRYFTPSSKVADSPGAELLHRSDSPNRGGAILSDTFVKYPSGAEITTLPLHSSGLLSVDGGPNHKTATSLSGAHYPNGSQARSDDKLHRSSEIRNPKSEIVLPTSGFSLVDDSISQGQEEGNTPARVGEGEALIYGEIINPDSLGPLSIRVYPYGKNSKVSVQRLEIPSTHGSFFDGVVDPRVRKFRANLNFPTPFAYLDIFIGERLILKEYLIQANDSLKLSIDLQSYQILFGGPAGAWFQAQQQIKQEIATHQFDSPRVLVDKNREALLDQSNHRQQWNDNQQRFGSKLLILEEGKDAVDYSLNFLRNEAGNDIPGFESLSLASPKLTKDEYSLLLADLVGNYYGGHLQSTRKYDLLLSRAKDDQATLDKLDEQLPAILSHLTRQVNAVDIEQHSSGLLLLLSEIAQTSALLSGNTFSQVVNEQFDGPLLDRLLGEYALNRMRNQDDPKSYVSEFLKHVSTEPWKSELEKNFQNFTLGVPLLAAEPIDLSGNSITWSQLKGKPALLYFYFSTCSQSARYFREFLYPLYQELQQSHGLELIAISVDNDQELWRKSISDYSNPALTNLNLPVEHWQDWLHHYLIESYPRIVLLDENGDLLSLRVRESTYEQLKESVISTLAEQKNKSESPTLNQ